MQLTTQRLEEHPHFFPVHLLVNVGNVHSTGAAFKLLLCARQEAVVDRDNGSFGGHHSDRKLAQHGAIELDGLQEGG